MGQLEWQASFDTGIEEIDNQHKQLLVYLNRLDNAKKDGGRAEIKDIIEGMGDYTLSHFAFEEALMEQAGYAYTGPHSHVHKTLIKRVEGFQKRFEAGEDILSEFYSFLKRWLINHIQRDDAAYVRAVKAHLQPVESGEDSSEPASERKGWISRAVAKFFG